MAQTDIPVLCDLSARKTFFSHDGTECPVEPGSKPSVLFRAGHYFPAGLVEARQWGNHWRWTAGRSTPSDIVAYAPA